MLEFLVQLQGSIRSTFSGNIDAFATTRDWTALLAVLPLGIVFGAAHALTPGHGKSVLAVYAVGSDLSRLRVLLTAAALTVTHIGTAVLLAVITNTLVTRTIVGAGQAPALELISRVLLVGVGLWLVLRAILGRPHVHGAKQCHSTFPRPASRSPFRWFWVWDWCWPSSQSQACGRAILSLLLWRLEELHSVLWSGA